MNTAELKNQLHQLIVETNDSAILKKMQSYFKELKDTNPDWWEELSESAKNTIKKGIKQADEGNLISHKEARTRIANFFKENE